MSLETLTAELDELRARVRSIEDSSDTTRFPSWKSTFGFARNNPDFGEAMRLGEEWRRRENQES